MSSIRKTVEGGVLSSTYDATEEMGAPALIYADQPDFVTLPPELGGGRCDVTAVEVANCPVCKTAGVQLLRLAPSAGELAVVCCEACGQYYWIKPPRS